MRWLPSRSSCPWRRRAAAAAPNPYTVTPLVSNNGVPGTTVDASLVNAWGLVAGPTTPWWVADNGADT